MSNVTRPDGGLGNRSNYFLNSGCNPNSGICVPVTGIKVIIDVTRDIVSNIGFSFQLNASTPKHANVSLQQYCFNVGGSGTATSIDYKIDNWPSKGFTSVPGDLINHGGPLLTLTQNSPGPTLPAGYQLIIELFNDSAEGPPGTISAVEFIVIDNHGNRKTSGKIALVGLLLTPHKAGKKANDADLAPISAFTFNLIGIPTGRQSYLSSGAGTITYSAMTALTVLKEKPHACVSPGDITAEEANSVYGELAAGPFEPGHSVIQTFGTVEPPPFVPGGPFAVSQQIGADQTNVYAVNREGQLVVFSAHGSGRWSASKPLGPTGLARQGAPVVASRQFDSNNRTDVFLMSQDGQLNMFWATGDGDWNGPVQVGPTKVTSDSNTVNLAVSRQFGAPSHTDVFLVDKHGTLNMLSVLGAGSSSAPPKLIGPAKSFPVGAPLAASPRFGAPNQTDVFVVDNQGALNLFSDQGKGSWSAQPAPAGTFPKRAYVAASQRFGVSDQTDLYIVGSDGQLNVFSVQGTGENGAMPRRLVRRGWLCQGSADGGVAAALGVEMGPWCLWWIQRGS